MQRRTNGVTGAGAGDDRSDGSCANMADMAGSDANWYAGTSTKIYVVNFIDYRIQQAWQAE